MYFGLSCVHSSQLPLQFLISFVFIVGAVGSLVVVAHLLSIFTDDAAEVCAMGLGVFLLDLAWIDLNWLGNKQGNGKEQRKATAAKKYGNKKRCKII